MIKSFLLHWNAIKYRLLSLYFYICKAIVKDVGCEIVMFHHVRDDLTPDIIETCKCSVQEFLDFIDFVQAHKRVVSLDELLSNKNQVFSNMIVITFDDVPDNFFYNAYPILKAQNLPFTLYIATTLIGKDGYLNKEQIMLLSKEPLCTIGAHTRNHLILSSPNINLKEEIFDCKNEIEMLTGTEVKHFAYPYGAPPAINHRVVKYIRNLGIYVSAVSTIPGSINRISIKRRFYLPRIYSQLYMSKFA